MMSHRDAGMLVIGQPAVGIGATAQHQKPRNEASQRDLATTPTCFSLFAKTHRFSAGRFAKRVVKS